VLIVAGGTGCEEMPFIGVEPGLVSAGHGLEPGNTLLPGATPAFATSLLASGVLHVVNRSTLHFELIGSTSGQVLDQIWLSKSLP
jgi:hypothetical protein